MEGFAMWANDRDRRDDPFTRERETERLSRDEYDRPRYGSPQPEHGCGFHAQHARSQDGRNIENVPVHEVMTRHIRSVHPATSVEHAARLMEECDCGALPVIGDSGVLVGFVTDRDIAIRIVARGRDARYAIVADCMTDRVFACYANESVAECMRQMARHQVRRMPIVDERQRLVGIVAQGDLARHAGHQPLPEERRALTEVVCAVSQPGQIAYR
jgi:CBS domain-containing protein